MQLKEHTLLLWHCGVPHQQFPFLQQVHDKRIAEALRMQHASLHVLIGRVLCVVRGLLAKSANHCSSIAQPIARARHSKVGHTMCFLANIMHLTHRVHQMRLYSHL